MILLHALILFSGFSRLLYLKDEATFDISLCNLPQYLKIVHLLEIESRTVCSQNKLEKFHADPLNLSKLDLSLFFQMTCSEPNFQIRCYEDIIKESEKCLNKHENEILKTLEHIDDDLTSYICKNKDNIIKYFEKLKGSSVTEFTNVVEQCFQLNYTRRLFKHLSTISPFEFEVSETCIKDKIYNKYPEDIRDVIMTTIQILKRNFVNMSSKTVSNKSKHLHRIVRDLGLSDKMQRLEIHVKNACVKNGEPTKKLEETLEKMKTCINEKQMFLVPKHVYIKNLDFCTKDAFTLLNTSLPDTYKYIPKMMLDIQHSIVNFLYDDFTIISSVLTPCVPKLQDEKTIIEYDKCVNTILTYTEDEFVDSKEKFCERFIPFNQCFITEVQKHCKESPELARFETDFMNAVKKPCDAK